MQMCTYLQSTNDCHCCRLVLNSVVSFRIGDSLRAGRGERATRHMQTHTHALLSRAEIKVEESAVANAASPSLHSSQLVSFKMFVRTMWNSHFTHDSVTMNHYSHWKSSHLALPENARVRLTLGLECKLRQYFIAITLAGIPGRSYSHKRGKKLKAFAFPPQTHVFNSCTPVAHRGGCNLFSTTCFIYLRL
jgi:hypothetical protein